MFVVVFCLFFVCAFAFCPRLLLVKCHVFKWASCLILEKSKQLQVSFLCLGLILLLFMGRGQEITCH